MSAVVTVFMKELKDAIRDRRSVFSAMLFPVLAPILVYVMLTAMISLRAGTDELVIPVQGIDNAPNLIAWLKERGVTIRAFEGDPRQAVTEKTEDFVLIIPAGYRRQLARVEPAVLELVSDSSRNDIRPSISEFQQLMRQYSSEIASLRLIARGVAPGAMTAVRVVDIEIASRQEIAAAALSFIPMYIVLAAFVAGMGVAVDGTAGERERRTLEYLLINPVTRFSIAAGKWLAASFFSAFGMVTTLALCVIVMQRTPLEELGLSFRISAAQVIAMILAVLPISFFAPGLQMFMGIFAKSFKDAQSYIGILVIFPVFPGLYAAFNPIPAETWMFGVPVLGQHLLLTEVLGGKEVALFALVLAAVSTLLLAIVVIVGTARLLRRESIIFS